ncbi:hypothetical protein BC827DRAFT_1187679 [Russula dissimulans]|nr:hypothetical protein BC827DRAFT_1187679 [Russula dissimulans]
MVSGQALSPEIHKIVIRLSRSAIFTRDEIAAYTGVSISSVHNILNYFDKYQTIKTSEDKEKKKRKKRAGDLRDVDIQYLTKPRTLCLNVEPEAPAPATAPAPVPALPPSSVVPYMVNPGLYMIPGTTQFASNYHYPPQLLPLYQFPNAQDVPQPLPHAYNNAAHAAHGHSSRQPLSTTVTFPDIGPWLINLDQQACRSNPNFTFSSLGESLERNGFYRISDLASNFVSAEKLMELLGTNYGTVVKLLQYAKEDTKACQLGWL